MSIQQEERNLKIHQEPAVITIVATDWVLTGNNCVKFISRLVDIHESLIYNTFLF
jgi:hypothetical protein